MLSKHRSRWIAGGFVSTSIALIVLYRDHQHFSRARFASQQQVQLHTVDSIQGREADVVILLTTRSDVTPETCDFLDDKLRRNVALTRCKHGQFVLGNVHALRSLPQTMSEPKNYNMCLNLITLLFTYAY